MAGQLHLPSEVWLHVFGHLSVTDLNNLRICCKYFKDLADHPSFWKDSVVVLGGQFEPYTREFWATLSNRKMSSVFVKTNRVSCWKRVVQWLPHLTTAIMGRASQKTLHFLHKLPNLKRVEIRSNRSNPLTYRSNPIWIDGCIVSQPQQLTRLSLLGVHFPPPVKDSFIAAVSQFTNLTCLVYHQIGDQGDMADVFHSIVTCLPKLKHLSWSWFTSHPFLMERQHDPSHRRPAAPPGGTSGSTSAAAGLTSLELIDYMNPLLPPDAMSRFCPNLQTLAVFHKYSHSGDTRRVIQQAPCPLRTWLSDLHQLTNLIIVKGPPVPLYARAIPATVTSLTLGVDSDIVSIGRAVPQLLHLHLDPWPSRVPLDLNYMPCFFPKLENLTLRQSNLPWDYYTMQMYRLLLLKNLKHLEIVDDNGPGYGLDLTKFISKLQALSNNRIQVTTFPHYRPLDHLCICPDY